MASEFHDPPKSQDDSKPTANGADNATDLIRDKLDRIYKDEPDAKQELAEAEATKPRSKHQRFMHELSQSGKDAAAIQTEWHNYYERLSAREKHEVWQEFYAGQPKITEKPEVKDSRSAAQATSARKHEAAKPARTNRTVRQQSRQKLRDARSKQQIQSAIRDKVTAGGKLQTKHHLQSLLFGLGMGAMVLIIFLFGFFNEVIIAPFIQPSRHANDTPLIVSNNISASAQPEVIIPKINVQIPADYSQITTDESQIENALENGIVHYPTTVKPGENGNAAFFGHSSNNIFNKGKYKFAFVLLHELVNGDTFYLSYNSKLYAYKVISKTVVEPSNVSVLGPVAGQTATATLITCDPPGTSLHRLIIVGQQISPDPSTNAAAAAPTTTGSSSSNLPGNGPMLMTRVLRTFAGKVIGIALIIAALFVTYRWVNQPKRTLQTSNS